MNMRNEKEIESILNKVLLEVVKEVGMVVRERLVEYIKEATYRNDYFPNYVYENGDGSMGSGEPSYEFEQAWRWKGVVYNKKEVSDKLYYAWENMTINRLSGRHWEDGKDTRKALADMMNVSGIVGHKEREPYWNLFIIEMDKTVNLMWKNKLQSKGLTII
jgi:hypothetical protein